jgi:hypothetical protein
MNYIKNPKNNKPIQVGGSAYRKLVKEGLITPEGKQVEQTKIKQVEQVEPKENDTVKELVKATTKNAIKIFNQVKSGEIPIPDDMTDENLSQYLTECMYLNLVKNKSKNTKKKSKKYVSSEEESESD